MLLFYLFLKHILTTGVFYFFKANISEKTVCLILPSLYVAKDLNSFKLFHWDTYSQPFQLIMKDKYLFIFEKGELEKDITQLTIYTVFIISKDHYVLVIASELESKVELIQVGNDFEKIEKKFFIFKTEIFPKKTGDKKHRNREVMERFEKLKNQASMKDLYAITSTPFFSKNQKKEETTNPTTDIDVKHEEAEMEANEEGKKIKVLEEEQMVEREKEEEEEEQEEENEEEENEEVTEVIEENNSEVLEETTGKESIKKIEIQQEVNSSKNIGNGKQLALLFVNFGTIMFLVGLMIIAVYKLLKK